MTIDYFFIVFHDKIHYEKVFQLEYNNYDNE